MQTRRLRRVEWPTVALGMGIWSLWLLLTWFHASLPPWLLVAGGGWTVAWHASLLHELIHGHPTRWPLVNRALGLPSMLLHLPFERYRASHLSHHRDHHLTDPLEDPETQYWTGPAWRGLGPVGRVLGRGMTLLAGRLVIGPLWAIGRFVWFDAHRLWRNVPGVRTAWAAHVPFVALTVGWLVLVCHMSLLTYFACFMLPGVALMLVRSFAEHRFADAHGHRTAIVERAPVMGMLFLFNNLHAAHHERPGLAWYRLPAWYAQERERLLFNNGGLVYRGYLDVARRFLLRPHHEPVHPHHAIVTPRPAAVVQPPSPLPVYGADEGFA